MGFSSTKLLGVLILRLLFFAGSISLVTMAVLAALTHTPANPVVITCITYILLGDMFMHTCKELDKNVSFRISKMEEINRLNFGKVSAEEANVRNIAEKIKKDIQ